MNSKTKGFIYGAIAAASYGMNPLFTLPLYAAGMSVDTVLFYRYFFAVIVLGILMKMQHQSFALRKADILPLVIMGLLFSFSSLWERFLKRRFQQSPSFPFYWLSPALPCFIRETEANRCLPLESSLSCYHRYLMPYI